VLIFFLFLKPSKIDISEISEFLCESPRSGFFLAVIVLPAGVGLSGRIETEQ
jgi:hypothetical protein